VRADSAGDVAVIRPSC